MSEARGGIVTGKTTMKRIGLEMVVENNLFGKPDFNKMQVVEVYEECRPTGVLPTQRTINPDTEAC